MSRVEDDGLSFGDLYIYNDGPSTTIIPRSHICSVSATYRSHPALLVFAAVSALAGLWRIATGDLVGFVLALIIAAGFVAWFYTSRRVGVSIASASGEIFYETKGKRRYELIEDIYNDLSANRPAP